MFTLTLEERATCPTTCTLLWECYGNSLPFSRRHEHGPALEEAIAGEIRKHLATRPDGIVVRLHLLGDFYSANYAAFWLTLIRRHRRLRVFGYTAHPADSDIGRIIMAGNAEYAPRDKRNMLCSKLFPGGSMLLNGTNSPGEFRADTADWVICEEVDGYPVTAGVEGDPIFLAFKHHDKRGAKADCRQHAEDQGRLAHRFAVRGHGTQEYRYVPCPRCGTMQRLVFGDGTGPGIRWEPKHRPTRAWYRCEAGCDIEEHHKADMDAAGKWRAHAPENWPHRSFHIWAAYSQFEGAAWLTIAKEFLASRRDKNLLVGFVNTVLGETFEVRGEAPQWRRLYDRREKWWTPNKVPADALILTAGLDVQKDRLEIFVWGWGVDRQSWLVEHKVIAHSPYDARAWVLATEFVQGA